MLNFTRRAYLRTVGTVVGGLGGLISASQLAFAAPAGAPGPNPNKMDEDVKEALEKFQKALDAMKAEDWDGPGPANINGGRQQTVAAAASEAYTYRHPILETYRGIFLNVHFTGHAAAGAGTRHTEYVNFHVVMVADNAGALGNIQKNLVQATYSSGANLFGLYTSTVASIVTATNTFTLTYTNNYTAAVNVEMKWKLGFLT